jgi:hypothetical protein
MLWRWGADRKGRANDGGRETILLCRRRVRSGPRTRIDPRTRILVSAGGSMRVGGPMGVPTIRCPVGIHALGDDRVDVPERNRSFWRSDCGQALFVFPCRAYARNARRCVSVDWSVDCVIWMLNTLS